MGKVYRARDISFDRIVAVKVLSDDFAKDKQAIKRFEREWKIIGKMEHPNIVQGFWAGVADGKHLLAMDFIEGIDLKKYVATNGKMPMDTAVNIVRQVAEGLKHANEQNIDGQKIVHRDIKPANIMRLTADGTAKILDFGLGKFYGETSYLETEILSASLTEKGVPLGTFDYTPPEQLRDPSNADIRSDIYALGCTFYTIVVGEVPYPSSTYKTVYTKMEAHKEQSPPSFLARNIDAKPATVLIAEKILKKMCEKEPKQRYQTPQELIDDIDKYQRANAHVGILNESITDTYAAISQANTEPISHITFFTLDKRPPETHLREMFKNAKGIKVMARTAKILSNFEEEISNAINRGCCCRFIVTNPRSTTIKQYEKASFNRSKVELSLAAFGNPSPECCLAEIQDEHQVSKGE